MISGTGSKLSKALLFLLTFLCFIPVKSQTVKPENRILIFSKTDGFRHTSIPAGQKRLSAIGQQLGLQVDTTENAALFTEENLRKYKAVVFLNTTGNILDAPHKEAFERYIQAGGGFAGIHAATDTEYEWPWYTKLVGAQFNGHPSSPNVQEGEAYVTDRRHPSMEGFPDRWKIKDEFYDFKNVNQQLKVLVKIDESTYKEGKMGDNHPMSWYHEYDGGKAFYTNFGHTDETYDDEVFIRHVTGGLTYVLAESLDYSKSRPEENRFTREILTQGLNEPTELVVLDDHRVIFTERTGKVKLYDPKTQRIKIVGEVPVYTKEEYGLMGINIDPKFKENKWMYLYYSPPSTEKDTAQHLSRFKYDDIKDTLLLNTEQVILTVPVKRTGCCHTGGSIEWDKDGLLYLSTGDDTNPFDSNGFSPSDSRPGREGWNAMATSSNTNDLRGKILRIKVREDGGYDIPEGNLFPDTQNGKARPEIYVMGNRNPYRISVDKHTGFLYWGEVGPDAGEDKDDRGPRGYDEVNQARKAGYFGWPLFVGANFAYNKYDFETKVSGPKFDPLKPVNDSQHNTGLTALPPAQPAFIYYPYAESPEFGPIVGKGGRNAMAGPVFYSEDYDNSNVKFPGYYHGKFFAYDWIRDMINIVTMTPEGDFSGMERFMPNAKFDHPIDMQFAKDGSLYILEYGKNWFTYNDDAKLTKITYTAGNRKPLVIASGTNTTGGLPLQVKFSSEGTLDYDGDPVSYEWDFGDGSPVNKTANPVYTYKKAGEFTATLKVTDSQGNFNTQRVAVKAGNDVPKVNIAVKGNQSFFWNDQPVAYAVTVTDKEDGSLANKKIAPADVNLNIGYQEGFDKKMMQLGHQSNSGFSAGKRLIELSDCHACHSIDKKSIGPTYLDVAKRYEKERNSVKILSEKIIKGGGGVWGEQAMSAHPQHTQEEAENMVKYIMSLGKETKTGTFPLTGTYTTAGKEKPGYYVLSASYTDKGGNVIGPLTAGHSVALRPATLKASTMDDSKDAMKYKLPGTENEVVVGTANGGFILFSDLDLSGIGSVKVSAFSRQGMTAGGKLQLRTGSPSGPLAGEVVIADDMTGSVNVPLKSTGAKGLQNLYLVFVNPNAGGKPVFAVDTLEFIKAGK